MDPVTGSVIVAIVAAAASIANAVINARGSAERLRADATISDQAKTISKQRAKINDLGGDPDDL